MLQRAAGSGLAMYLAGKAAFDRRRRKSRLSFDALYGLFASDLSYAEIARRAGVSRPRINRVFDDYFRDLFGMSGLEREQRRQAGARQSAARRLAQAVAKDRILNALLRSVERAGRGRRIEPIICKRGRDPVKRFRHRAVLVDGRQVEPVHHLRRKRVWPAGGIAYAVTSLSRKALEGSPWTIFYVDVPSHRRRVIRSKSAKLIKALFPPGVARRNIYIPLGRSPEAPRYDFLADEDNWG
jgi:AcrR family transcriptional regulator